MFAPIKQSVSLITLGVFVAGPATKGKPGLSAAEFCSTRVSPGVC